MGVPSRDSVDHVTPTCKRDMCLKNELHKLNDGAFFALPFNDIALRNRLIAGCCRGLASNSSAYGEAS